MRAERCATRASMSSKVAQLGSATTSRCAGGGSACSGAAAAAALRGDAATTTAIAVITAIGVFLARTSVLLTVSNPRC
jgi:hypothetical protein